MTTTTIERNAEDGDDIVHVRDYRTLRQVARDWEQFSNDALGLIQIPAEDKTRSFRQYPIEADPPRHTLYRELVRGTFDQPNDPGYVARIRTLVEESVKDALAKGDVEVVEGFALPLQSRALTHLLGVPIEEAELWIGWGIHAFRAETGYDLDRAKRLVDYIADRLERAPDLWPESLFAFLRRAEIEGEPLSHEMQMGFAHLVFAGGRDTIIKLVSCCIAYLARHPEAMAQLRDDPSLAMTLTEELVRYISPLPFLGRICTHATDIDGVAVAAGQRVALWFADANRDPAVFADADKIVIDRRPNPHVGFGSGPHACLGSGHARLLARTVLLTLARQVTTLEVVSDDTDDRMDFDKLLVRFA